MTPDERYNSEGRRPWRKTKNRVLALFASNPTQSSNEIAKALGLHPCYVTKTIARAGLKLPGSKR